METVKIWTALTALMVVLSVMFSWMYLEQVDRANASYQEAKLAVEGTRNSLDAKKQNLQRRIASQRENEQAQSMLAQSAQLLQTAESARKDALGKEKEVRRGIASLLADMTEAVSVRRSKAPGKEYPEVRLKDGKTFLMARIRKIEENAITFLHSGGIGSASVEYLPEAFLEEYDLGANAMIKQLRELEASLDKPRKVAVEEPVAASSAPLQAGISPADQSKLQAMKFSLMDLQSKLSAAVANRIVLEQQVEQATAAVSNAESRGIPTTNLRIAHQKASAAVVATNNYILGIQGEITKLQIRINEFPVR